MNNHLWRHVATIKHRFTALDNGLVVNSLSLFIDSTGDNYAMIGNNTGLIEVADPEQYIREHADKFEHDGPLLLGLPADCIEIHDAELMP